MTLPLWNDRKQVGHWYIMNRGSIRFANICKTGHYFHGLSFDMLTEAFEVEVLKEIWEHFVTFEQKGCNLCPVYSSYIDL